MLRGMHKAAVCIVAILCAAGSGCGGKGGGSDPVVPPPPGPNPVFHCADSPVAIDHVALTCGVATDVAGRQLEVRIGAPSTATDIAEINFDVVFDPSLLTYVPDSAVAGSIFFQPPGPGALLAARTMPGDPGRLVVGMHRIGSAGGVQAKPGYDLIVRFSMKVAPGAFFDPQPLHFENSEVKDSSGLALTSITFSDQLLLSNQ